MNNDTCIYPTLNLTQREIKAYFTPSAQDLALCAQNCQQNTQRACFLILLKTTQFLHYVPKVEDISYTIIRHVNQSVTAKRLTKSTFAKYFRSGAKTRHLRQIRKHLQLKAVTKQTSTVICEVALSAAATKAHLIDIINAIIEHLIRNQFELPSLSTLETHAKQARAKANSALFSFVSQTLTDDQIYRIDELVLNKNDGQTYSEWNRLKTRPKKPKPKKITEYLVYVDWLKALCEGFSLPPGLPAAKIEQFKHEAQSLNAAQMLELKPQKRHTLALIFVLAQLSEALDNVAEMFIKTVQSIDSAAKQREMEAHLSKKATSEKLVSSFQSVLESLGQSVDDTDLVNTVKHDIEPHIDSWLSLCDKYLAKSDQKHLPFLLEPFERKRKLLFDCLQALDLSSLRSSQDLLNAWHFVSDHKDLKGPYLSLVPRGGTRKVINLNWVSVTWQKSLNKSDQPFNSIDKVHKKLFEICVFSHLKEELRCGNITADGASTFGHYTDQLVDDTTLEEELDDYGNLVGLPTEGEAFTAKLQEELSALANEVDHDFPSIEEAHFENKVLKLKRAQGTPKNPELERLDNQINRAMKKVSIVDIITDTVNWLNLDRHFKPLSDHKGKIADQKERLISTIFCYGCNIGPNQTANCLKGVNRRQLAWLNLRYTSDRSLSKAISHVIKEYQKLEITQHWGNGSSMSADGTHRETLEDNLLSEFHIRYRKTGRICYFLTADTYICMFSHFIPCGIHESNFLFDGLANSDLQNKPNRIHGDSHAQTLSAFGLGYLLGIELMPRIKNVKKLDFFRPMANQKFKNIGPLFKQSINWPIIAEHLTEMYRIAISIKRGTLTPSTLLRRMGTKSRKNRLFYAFQELGKVIRTKFLLKYISDYQMRCFIQRETNKSEQFNNFAQWVSFFNGGRIDEQHRHEQEKMVKHQHLLANMVILHNAQAMTQALNDMKTRGDEINEELLRHLSPYRTSHINRLGEYQVNVKRTTSPITWHLLEDVDLRSIV